MESGLPPHDKYIFDTKEEIIESIRAEGFEPDVIEHVDEENGEVFKYLNINLRCKHGYAANERNYVLQDDNRWELIEERIDDPCPECEIAE
ncbi:hypothetical protein [uncultured Methanolobus sp.]|uniref:hypothetical protein n=1 Tax=uncultured Methanolobus sp. TaxID=218300 RepID=UPI0029C7EFFA|nr:hypothetical protein [uncultured Methanolobus sp.]